MAGFADVIGSIDQAASGPQKASPVPKGGFSSVIQSIDTGGASSEPVAAEKPARNIGTREAFSRGAFQGMTSNFGDELDAFSQLGGGGPVIKTDPNAPEKTAGIHHLLYGVARYLSGNEDARKQFDQIIEQNRKENKQAEEQHPIASGAGDLSGALIQPTGKAGAATKLGRAAQAAAVGAGYGALSGAGEGEGIEDRATRSATGGAIGGAIGGVLSPVVEGAVNLGGKILQPVINRARGIFNPEDEAARRVAGAIQKDRQIDPDATARLTGTEFQKSAQEGGPAVTMDLGGEATRDLARSAANTSSEGRFLLNKTINERFEGQSNRMYDWLNNTFHFPNAEAQQEAIDKVQKTVNNVNYRKALAEGDKQIMTPEMERLMSSPTVVEAMQRAAKSGKDRAVTEGLGGFNPGVTIENGVVSFRKSASGVPTYPNLQFWDATKRELDDMAKSAGRRGETGQAGVIGDLAKSLRGELDAQVPSYQAARAGAAHFFGAENALDAGQKFVNDTKMSNDKARRLLAGMSDTEKRLFQDGFVSKFMDDVSKMPDRRSILNKIANSPNARERLNIALGPQKATELEAHLRVEGVMDEARKAIQGNSTTARQLFNMTLAGGGLGASIYAAYESGDPKQLAYGALASAIAGHNHKVDSRLAMKVAEMLVSKDPEVIRRGMKVLVKDTRMLDNLRSFDKRFAAIGGQQAPNNLIAPGMAGRADENDPERNRVRQ